MKVGDKFTKDGEVVKVIDVYFNECFIAGETCIWFCHSTKIDHIHVLTERDFLEQYKHYKPVYEYKYVFINKIDGFVEIDQYFYANENEFYSAYNKENIIGQRLDFTKRERVQ